MRELIRRVWHAIRLRHFEADLAEEIESHRAMKQREVADAGVEATEAAFATQRVLGNVALAQDRARDVWISPGVQGISQDIRGASRSRIEPDTRDREREAKCPRCKRD